VRLEQHDLSKCFPVIEIKEFGQLVDDIKENGLLNPIVIFDGKVLDGWHRYLACQKAGADIKTIVYEGEEPDSFAWSMNGHRRHMNSSQAAKSIVDVRGWRKRGKPVNGPQGPFRSTKEMASESGTSLTQIKRAKHVTKNGSKALNEQVKKGEITLKAAERKTKNKKKGPIGAAPKPPKEAKPTKSEVKALAKLQGEFASLKEVHEKLIEEYNELMENRDTLADEVQTYDDVRDNESAKALIKLRSDNRFLTRRRDELMNQCAEAKKLLASWRNRAEKCEKAHPKAAKK